jgi:hypothetical protein
VLEFAAVRIDLTKPARLALGVGLAGVVCGGLALGATGVSAVVLAWIATACFIVSAAYAFNRPDVFGKRGGQLLWWRTVPVLPYLVAFRISCALMRWWRQLPVLEEVVPGLHVGGRLRPEEVPRDTTLLVDLTCEFSEPALMRMQPGYRCLPVLDGACPPDEEACLALLDELAHAQGTIVVHCESGKGRAPTLAALVLMARGLAVGPLDAVERIRAGRPSAKPTGVDLEFMARIAGRLRPPGSAPAPHAGLPPSMIEWPPAFG